MNSHAYAHTHAHLPTQCCDKSKSTTGILLGENQVPVHDLLTALKEIHLMYQGNLAGKIIVDAVSLGIVV
jgi:hypothetical protein